MADTHRTLRRPEEGAGPVEITGYHRLVARNLSELDVGYGEEFVVVKASEFNKQPSLDEAQLGPFASGSETSRKAALDNYPRAGGQRHKILSTFYIQIPKWDGEADAPTNERHGYTRDDLERVTHLSGNAIRPRVKELLAGGYLEETEETRVTRAGSAATVLQITEDGRRVFLPENMTHDKGESDEDH